MISDTQKFFEKMKKEYWVTDTEIAELCARLNDAYQKISVQK